MKHLTYPAIIFFILIMATVAVWGDVGASSAVRNITVLVIDTGIDSKHPMFWGRSIICPHSEDCGDFMGHGTHVASLILNGSLTAKNQPTSKVCGRVIIHSCDYKPATGYAAPYIECLNYAKWLKPDFINFSSSGSNLLRTEYDTFSALKDTKIVVAAGNEGDNLYESPSFPAIYPRIAQIAPKWGLANLSNVITVSARTSEGAKYTKSNYADFTVSELGVNVNSAAPGNDYEIRSGTSMAAALHTNKLVQEKCNEN